MDQSLAPVVEAISFIVHWVPGIVLVALFGYIAYMKLWPLFRK